MPALPRPPVRGRLLADGLAPPSLSSHNSGAGPLHGGAPRKGPASLGLLGGRARRSGRPCYAPPGRPEAGPPSPRAPMQQPRPAIILAFLPAQGPSPSTLAFVLPRGPLPPNLACRLAPPSRARRLLPRGPLPPLPSLLPAVAIVAAVCCAVRLRRHGLRAALVCGVVACSLRCAAPPSLFRGARRALLPRG